MMLYKLEIRKCYKNRFSSYFRGIGHHPDVDLVLRVIDSDLIDESSLEAETGPRLTGADLGPAVSEKEVQARQRLVRNINHIYIASL